jgi:hypothetical protein
MATSIFIDLIPISFIVWYLITVSLALPALFGGVNLNSSASPHMRRKRKRSLQ